LVLRGVKTGALLVVPQDTLIVQVISCALFKSCTGGTVAELVSVINSREPQNSPEIFLQLAVQEKAA
jgi:hypothetical protein